MLYCYRYISFSPPITCKVVALDILESGRGRSTLGAHCIVPPRLTMQQVCNSPAIWSRMEGVVQVNFNDLRCSICFLRTGLHSAHHLMAGFVSA